ncbi:MAG: isochorismate synthase [Actinomycetes bacterium]
MKLGRGQAPGPDLIGRETQERLLARAEGAAARARQTGEPTLAAVMQECDPNFDPSAVVLAARRAGEPWGLTEQPDRGGYALATLGEACELKASGAERFGSVAEQWRNLAHGANSDQVDGPPGSGPIAFGGFAFDGRERAAGPWRGFGSASMVVPTVSVTRRDGVAMATLQVVVGPEDDPSVAVDAALRCASRLDRSSSLPDGPGLAGTPPSVESGLPPEHYEAAVARALDAIDEGRVEKVVLAREVLVERGVDHDPGGILSVLREVFPSCFLFAVGRGDASLIGASPELLIRREGLHASTVALAGSAPRSADPAVDAHIGERLLRSPKDRSEQAIVTHRISRTLEPSAVWVSGSEEPQLARVANIQHLATPIRARLREPVAAIELAGRLHPTPAVGGEPWSEASAVINELEGLDRGWYASPIGWSDAAENGEFCVALRCALLRGSEARCYAGVGVVAGSDPASELAETELKLQALLPVVSL